MKTHVAFARYSHAESTVAEHLYAHRLATGPRDVLILYAAVNLCHLVHVEFAGQHSHVGELGIEPQCLGVGNVELRTQVHLHTALSAVAHHGHVGGDDRADASFRGRVDDTAHVGNVGIVDDGVHSEISLHTVLVAGGSDVAQVT